MVLDRPPGHPEFSKMVPCPVCGDGRLAERLAETSQLHGWLCQAGLNGYREDENNEKAYYATAAFILNPTGWLTLWGDYGTGKTHLLAAAVNACNRARVGAVYYTLPDLLDLLRDGYGQDDFSPRVQRLLAVPVLAIDEVDKARLTDWAREKVYQICDARYRRLTEQGTLFASNTEPDPKDPDLGYLYSRMSEGTVVGIGGGDFRGMEG